MPLIGVSVAVPEPCGRHLQDYRVALGDEEAAQIPTHITLVPPTRVDPADIDGVVAHLASAAAEHEAFGIHLRGTGTFRPVSPVVFIGVVEGISECELLAKRVRTGPLAVDVEHPYHPHVTVAHHLGDDLLDRAFTELAGFDCRFDVVGFWLYEFDDEAGWVPQREFELGVGGGTPVFPSV